MLWIIITLNNLSNVLKSLMNCDVIKFSAPIQNVKRMNCKIRTIYLSCTLSISNGPFAPHSKSWRVYGRHAEGVKEALLTVRPELTVVLNPEKPRRKSFEITLVEGERGKGKERCDCLKSSSNSCSAKFRRVARTLQAVTLQARHTANPPFSIDPASCGPQQRASSGRGSRRALQQGWSSPSRLWWWRPWKRP